MPDVSAGVGHLRIGELSRRSGVSPELLRAWEQRYGLLRPLRSAGGFRLSRDGKTAYTANGPSNDVSVIDLAGRTVTKKIPAGNRPWGLAIIHR